MNDPFLASYLVYDKQRRLSHEAAAPPASDSASARLGPAAWYRAAARVTRRRGSAV